MTPKQLVPSLELCQRAQKLRWKKETHFVWYERWYKPDASIWKVWECRTSLVRYYGAIFAPTLQEVLEDIFASGYRVPTLYSAEAALELWCELEERKRE